MRFTPRLLCHPQPGRLPPHGTSDPIARWLPRSTRAGRGREQRWARLSRPRHSGGLDDGRFDGSRFLSGRRSSCRRRRRRGRRRRRLWRRRTPTGRHTRRRGRRLVVPWDRHARSLDPIRVAHRDPQRLARSDDHQCIALLHDLGPPDALPIFQIDRVRVRLGRHDDHRRDGDGPYRPHRTSSFPRHSHAHVPRPGLSCFPGTLNAGI